MTVYSPQMIPSVIRRPRCVESQLGCQYNLVGHCCHASRVDAVCPLTLVERSGMSIHLHLQHSGGSQPGCRVQ
jgi:hypothetical protein